MPFPPGKSLVDGDDQCRRIHQRDMADPQSVLVSHFSNSAAVTTDCAISITFLFSFIAVRRIRT